MSAYEWKLVALRKTQAHSPTFNNPAKAVRYWRQYVAMQPHFNEACECLTVIFLNAHKRIMGHQVISIGTADSVLVHPREVFRTAIVANAIAIVIVHNHPSGEAVPSTTDKRITNILVNAGKIIGIELADHIVITQKRFVSLATCS